ncbi:hypothetical protein PDO_1905 [Rhizobium sp. PDO1-076]|uniref:hypothetical protein n=1 Tax=Rhizobium sp. PDO1-076 TaxID=1125979 RepID=UPI00024E35D2|nr:hypothetical protein [Rhizobium sp. PDO1-076]EHS51514.1 hypothetical protein PDO_1905 [Rhizobium sp. PDO1-076]
MASTLPLFEHPELVAIQREREQLRRQLGRGGCDAHSRIRREHKLALLTARQIQIEARLKLGARP